MKIRLKVAMIALAVSGASFQMAHAAPAVTYFNDGAVSLSDIENGTALLDVSDAIHITKPGAFIDYFVFSIAGDGSAVASVTSNPLPTSTGSIKNILPSISVSLDNVSGSLSGLNDFEYSNANTPILKALTYTAVPGSATLLAADGVSLSAGQEYAFVVQGTATGSKGGQYSGSAFVSPVPLPGAIMLFGSGLAGLGVAAARRRKAIAAA
jgi:hypothetical protein